MSPLPKEAKDFVLAPLAAEIDLNLRRLREKSPKEIEYELEMELDTGPIVDDRDERAERVRYLALRNVDLRGWDASITEDNSAIRLTGGSVSLDLALGANVLRFLEGANA
jgi:hypothetical protein